MYVEDQIDGKPIQVKRYKISRQAAALRRIKKALKSHKQLKFFESRLEQQKRR